MLNSQTLETGIGLALMLFILATAASGILDLGRRLLNSRSKDLEVALKSFLDNKPMPMLHRIGKAFARIVGAVGAPKLEGTEEEAWQKLKSTSVYRGAAAARNQVRPAYLSAKSFAEAIEEMQASSAPLTGPLKQRIDALSATVEDDTVRFRAGLETWFDEAMSGLSGRYQKKSTMWLFFIGLALAFSLNASFPHVARDLWHDSVTRAAVVAAAETYAPAPATTPTSIAESLEQTAKATEDLTAIGIPIGWAPPTPDEPARNTGWWSWHILGWLMTAALVSLGGPFWFDLLGRLTAARSPKPPKAADDETSATRTLSDTPNPPLPLAPAPDPSPAEPKVEEASPAKPRWWHRK